VRAEDLADGCHRTVDQRISLDPARQGRCRYHPAWRTGRPPNHGAHARRDGEIRSGWAAATTLATNSGASGAASLPVSRPG
jgi:hypothetical protein